ncbi:hypothetical protein RHSIM_Rhsim03G0209300 [Rhododendron simsii]|uniref:beta-ketoacyl-[acyl-carrier-protein] synthase I n=1 Tax=Rhododendron simsii TaxID=118357 RepID=A0A834H6F1_RHOSS|nr:hypothetical protein RHSIM_Rhsim03G0209300 [Rhododendron simsii]
MAEIASGSLMVFHPSHKATLHTWPMSSFPPNISSSRQKQRGQVRAMASPISAPKRETDPKKRIVITGMGLVSVLGNDVDTFYNKLLNGESGIRRIDRFDVSDYPVQIAGQVPDFLADGYFDGNKYQNLDDCWKFCLFAAKTALQDANLSPQVLKTLDRSKMGAVVGSGAGGSKTLYNAVDALLKQDYSKVLTSYYPNNIGPALLAIETGFTGPIYSISTACASSNFCIYAAANHIKKGEAQVMVAGGTDSGVIPSGLCGFMACKALSSRNDEPQKASRPWDKGRDGFVLSEGSGVLVMESLEHATKRGANIIAEYLGGAISCDAHHLTDPRSDGSGVAACISKSLKIAGVSPEEVLKKYLVLATGELRKCSRDVHTSRRFSRGQWNKEGFQEPARTKDEWNKGKITSVKFMKFSTCALTLRVFVNIYAWLSFFWQSMIGHAMGAAGALEAIATLKAIATGWLHPTINQYNLEPEVTIDTIPNGKIKHGVNVAVSNSFGFGGHNSAVVFAPFTP